MAKSQMKQCQWRKKLDLFNYFVDGSILNNNIITHKSVISPLHLSQLHTSLHITRISLPITHKSVISPLRFLMSF